MSTLERYDFKSAKADMRTRPKNRCQQHDEILIALYFTNKVINLAET